MTRTHPKHDRPESAVRRYAEKNFADVGFGISQSEGIKILLIGRLEMRAATWRELLQRAQRYRQQSKPRTKIKGKSTARKQRDAEWRKVTKQAIEEVNGVCQIRKSPDCTGRANTGHHLQKRRCNNDTKDNCMAACAQCNLWVEDNDAEARRLGFAVSSHAKFYRCSTCGRAVEYSVDDLDFGFIARALGGSMYCDACLPARGRMMLGLSSHSPMVSAHGGKQ